jgi:hypothetical protein
MGWSEQYWEDVKAELAHPTAEPQPANDVEALDRTASRTPEEARDEQKASDLSPHDSSPLRLPMARPHDPSP